jgi:DNA topoisomerase-1
MILESGAKARTVNKYLGKGWIVEACNGHVQDLPSGKGKNRSKAMWASNNGNLPEPPWDWTDGAEKVINKILDKATRKGVDEVYIATDPDREGEFIAWRLSILFSNFPVVKRVTFNEITKTAVNEAIQESGEIDSNLVDAAKVRRFMDRLVGFRCSRFSKSWRLASMGRVQTPTLGFIVERELEREAHVPIEFHSVHVDSDKVRFNVRFHEKNDEDAWTDDSGKHRADRTADSGLAKDAFDALENAKAIRIVSVKEGKTNRKPQPPFTTATLLQSASSTLGWSVAKTSKMASTLYQSGHVTYIRTDSTRTNSEARERVRKYIKSEFGDDHLGSGVLGPDAKKGASNVQDAHEAIRPTRPEKTDVDASADECRLYGLIWARFAASQMSPSIRERRDMRATVDDLKKPLTASASWRIHTGWEAVYAKYHGDVRTDPPKYSLEEESEWNISKSEENPLMVTDETKPPNRFSESSIVQAMKKAEIGRPSTYVSTVSNLSTKKYVKVEGSSLIPTDGGRMLWLDVVPFYNEQEDSEKLFTPLFTSKMEDNLNGIEHGRINGPEVWTGFVEEFRSMHNRALEKKREFPTPKQMALLESRIPHLNDKRRAELLSGKSLSELTGDDARSIIEQLFDSEEDNGHLPPSEKQTNLIVKLSDQAGLELDVTLEKAGVADISELTGGREGTASELISQMIENSKNLPATPPQVDLVNKLSEQYKVPLSEMLAIAGLKDISEMNKADASIIINEMKKRSRRSGSRQS